MNRRRLLRIGVGACAGIGASAAYVALTPPDRYDRMVDEPLPDPDRAEALPAITLAGAEGGPGFSTAEIAEGGRAVAINVFASWCAPCVVEAPVLNDLARAGVTFWGIGFRDKPEAIAAFLARHGNPFQRLGFDLDGRATAPLNLSGVPETLLVDATGTIRWRWLSAITPEMVEAVLLPRWRALRPPA
jgi:cytochrome c biogenesis protein CcmG/thiol:disulfide interchange protein DsbE